MARHVIIFASYFVRLSGGWTASKLMTDRTLGCRSRCCTIPAMFTISPKTIAFEIEVLTGTSMLFPFVDSVGTTLTIADSQQPVPQQDA